MGHRTTGQLSFAESRIVAAQGGNETLARIDGLVDWSRIEQALGDLRGGSVGRPPFPPLLMLKALLLQRLYALSDPQMESALKDRLSFRAFVGLGLSEAIPDHSTLCRFRQDMGDRSAAVFAQIVGQIEASGFVLKQGTLIDASLVRAAVNPPKPPADVDLAHDAQGRPASKLVASPLDGDAAWTKKDGGYHFGFKLHVAMDKGSRIVRRALLTPANVNESAVADGLIMGDEAEVLADKAYDSKARSDRLKAMGIKNGIMRRGHSKKPLTAREILRNKRLSRRRGVIEPIFALVKNVHGLARARYRGLQRNATAFLLTLTAMNLKRWARCQPNPA